jgi:hypothetical protein
MRRLRHPRRLQFRYPEPGPLLRLLVVSVMALYLASIVLKEFVEGHVSLSRSLRVTVVIGLLALVAAWRAAHSCRRLSEIK